MGENNTLNHEIQTEVCNDMTVENGFDALALSPELRKAVEAMGYTEPTDIQRQAIPLLRSGADIIALPDRYRQDHGIRHPRRGDDRP